MFVAVDPRQQALELRDSLLGWLGSVEDSGPIVCPRGTLYVDDAAALSRELQHLLECYARRLEGAPADTRLGPGPARLAVGSDSDLGEQVRAGEFLGELLDSLDKMSLHLGTRPLEAAS